MFALLFGEGGRRLGRGGVLGGGEVRPVPEHRSEKGEEGERWHGHFLVCDVVVVGVQALKVRPGRQAVGGGLRVGTAPLLFRQSRWGDEGVRRRSEGMMERGRTVGNLARGRRGRGQLPMGFGKGAETASSRQRDLIHAGQVFPEEVVVWVVALRCIWIRSQVTVSGVYVYNRRCAWKERPHLASRS